jgi:glycosyltransferase involved in cell wall biosynthesis
MGANPDQDPDPAGCQVKVLVGILSELSHERRLERMAASLRRAGHEVAVTWVDNGCAAPSAFWQGWALHRLPNPRAGRRKLYFLRFMAQWRALLARERPEAVLAVDPPALGPAWFERRRRPFRLIYDSREHYRELPTIRSRPAVAAFWRALEARGMRCADASFAVCGSIAAALAADYGLTGVGVVRNLPEYAYRPREDAARRRAALRRRLPELGDEEPLLVYAGGFWPGYDFRPLQQALGLIETRPRLIYFGEGPGEAGHRSHAAGLPWSGRIHFAGKVPPGDLPELLRGADLGLVPVPDLGLSYRYLLPNKLFEYLQAGLPVLASPLPELSAVVLGRGLGRCAEPGDPDALVAAATELLQPAWRPAREAAFAAAAEELCWEREEGEFLRLFEGRGARRSNEGFDRGLNLPSSIAPSAGGTP